MKVDFEVEFLDEVLEFLSLLTDKERKKIIYNIDRSRYNQDAELLKKISDNIWEFRAFVNKKSIRIFSFWVKTHEQKTLIIATHGIIKKSNKTPKQEIEKAERIRKAYFHSKS